MRPAVLCGVMILGTLVGLCGTIQRGAAVTVDISASKDNTLYEDAEGDLSNGAGEHFFVGTTNTGAKRRGLIAFNIAERIPAGSIITSVTLKLHMSMTRAGSKTITLHKLRADWGEGASDAPGEEGSGTGAQTMDATWIHTFFATSTWTTPGGDFPSRARASAAVAGEAFYTWGSTARMVADVQAWLDQPDINFGWLLQGNETTFPTAKRFDTKEAPEAANRPVLRVEFTPVCDGKPATIIGSDDDDILTGTEDDDVIVGLGGKDVIYGLGGNDTICGGPGDDVIFGDAGADRIFGDVGNDVLLGGTGPDQLFGGDGHDVLLGESGADVLSGGSGDDSLHGGDGNDRLLGGSGNDTLRGDAGDDELSGGTGSDVCDGGSDTDAILGGCEASLNIP
jgi:Ca2+-binding RTX toxin-like protein